MKKKTFIMILALVLVFGMAVGGTLAYLTAQTQTVQNTFVVAKIGALKIQESPNTIENGANTLGSSKTLVADATRTPDYGEGKTSNEFLVVPAVDINKDPEVVFTPAEDNNVAAYVFLKVTTPDVSSGNGWVIDGKTLTYKVGTKTVLTATIGDDFTAVTGQTGVYYFEVAQNTTADVTKQIFKALTNPSVTNATIEVADDLTSTELAGLTQALSNLTFQAYSIQKDGFTGTNAVADAYAAAAATN